MTKNTWATREQWLNHFVKLARPIFLEKIGQEIPDSVRVSVGWASRGIRSKSIGECWSSEASADGATEIFVSPKLDDSFRIAGVLSHELVHAVVGIKAKHGPIFKKAAVAIGLEGKMTATTEGPEWHKWAGPILDVMGPIPHAALSGGETSAKPKQPTRMIKCVCDTCDLQFRMTKKWIDLSHGEEDAGLRCPRFSCDGVVNVEGGEE